MAEYRYQQQQRPTEGIKSLLPEKGPSKSQVLAVITLLPVGGTLLLLSGITLAGSVLGLAVTTPLFLLFSPVLVPAALLIGGTVTGFLASGAFGITGLSSLSWMMNCLRKLKGTLPETLEQAKRRAQEAAGQVGLKAKEASQTTQGKAQEVAKT